MANTTEHLKTAAARLEAFEAGREATQAKRLLAECVGAMRLVMDDLDRYAVTHGPGPDTRLETFRAVLAKATA